MYSINANIRVEMLVQHLVENVIYHTCIYVCMYACMNVCMLHMHMCVWDVYMYVCASSHEARSACFHIH